MSPVPICLIMSNLEIKGNILEMIAKINDKNSLEELSGIISEFIGNHMDDSDFYEELNDDEREKLNEALKESENEENLTDHKEVMNKYRKWLNK